MYPRNQMPSLTTRNDTQKFIYSNICINFLRDENSTFQRIITKKKKKGESLKDVSTYGTSIQSPTLSRYSWILIFHRINPFSAHLSSDTIQSNSNIIDAIIIFAHLNIPQKKGWQDCWCPQMHRRHNDSRKKKWRNERKFGAKGATRSVDVYCV